MDLNLRNLRRSEAKHVWILALEQKSVVVLWFNLKQSSFQQMTGQVIVIFYFLILGKTLSGYNIIFTRRWWLFGKHTSGANVERSRDAQTCGISAASLGLWELSRVQRFCVFSPFIQSPELQVPKEEVQAALSSLQWSLDMFTDLFVTILRALKKTESWSKVQRHCEVFSHKSRDVIQEMRSN